ncbi:hypothetical protein QVD17_14621 [Tagetes erecta]|uniref:Uncharacterized protein n=1 Tax=Tagetes erecta TaxID=13708 RepID=A0AAD8KMT6_TARER|nr:hypothetical protein QVD17_14621 [Tagetes erecta]
MSASDLVGERWWRAKAVMEAMVSDVGDGGFENRRLQTLGMIVHEKGLLPQPVLMVAKVKWKGCYVIKLVLGFGHRVFVCKIVHDDLSTKVKIFAVLGFAFWTPDLLHVSLALISCR